MAGVTKQIVVALPIITAALVLSYLLARAGEPQSHWLWCTMLKAC